jgi:hypothetical protein
MDPFRDTVRFQPLLYRAIASRAGRLPRSLGLGTRTSCLRSYGTTMAIELRGAAVNGSRHDRPLVIVALSLLPQRGARPCPRANDDRDGRDVAPVATEGFRDDGAAVLAAPPRAAWHPTNLVVFSVWRIIR